MKKYGLLLLASVVNIVCAGGVTYALEWRRLKNSVQFTGDPATHLMVNELLRLLPWLVCGAIFAWCLWRVRLTVGVPVFFLLMAGCCFVLCTAVTLPGETIYGSGWQLPMHLVYMHLALAGGTLVAVACRAKR